jgi:hypothetical protein
VVVTEPSGFGDTVVDEVLAGGKAAGALLVVVVVVRDAPESP